MAKVSQRDASNVPKEHHMHRVGDWMPADHRAHKHWLGGIIEHVDENPKDLHPVLVEFKDLIESNTRLYLLFSSMFEELPTKKPYADDPTGHKQIRDFPHMLALLNHLMTTGPHWNTKSEHVGMVGLPINAVLDWPMGTPSGYACFLDPEVNAMLKKVLNAWGKFLTSPESAEQVLGTDEGGWFSSTGKSDLEAVANNAVGDQSAKFEELFVCDAKKPHHGFKSWDDFFTRLFRFDEGVRPVAEPDNDDVIANACESKPFKYATDVKLRDHFWLKGQPYSLKDMLGHDSLASHFEGGTVYQAFLSALSYHRWHSPVSGTVKKAFVEDGTYYAEPLWEGLGDPERTAEGKGIDEKGQTISQGFLTSVATRGIIFIEADNPKIGLMAFIGVGMCEVSTCDITVKEGQKVKKGEQLGMFHFGGSTHCLIFRKGVELEGFPQPGREVNVPIRSKVGVVKG